MQKHILFLFSLIIICSSCGAKKEIVPQIQTSRNLEKYRTLIKGNEKLHPLDLPHFDDVVTNLKVPAVFERSPGKPLKAGFISDVLEASGADGNFLILELSPPKGLRNYSTLMLIEPVNSETLFSLQIKGREISTCNLKTIEKALGEYIRENTSSSTSLH